MILCPGKQLVDLPHLNEKSSRGVTFQQASRKVKRGFGGWVGAAHDARTIDQQDTY